MDKAKIKDLSKKWLKRFFLACGIFFCFLLALSFTDVPYYAYYWLGTSSPKLEKKPDLIVLLGGGGMPSPDGFMRCFYASKAAAEYPESKLVIALPFNDDGSTSQLELMAGELRMRGVDSMRINFEPEGFNTRSQAEHIVATYTSTKNTMSVLIVTSPEHMYRAIRTFKQAGFTNVGGEAAFEDPVNEKKVKDTAKTKDTRVKSLSLRYNMWSYLNYELLVLREYTAITYYWIKGWI
jgi:uncharacterized SAM-binding protein YcdF (DUF218 family)